MHQEPRRHDEGVWATELVDVCPALREALEGEEDLFPWRDVVEIRLEGQIIKWRPLILLISALAMGYAGFLGGYVARGY
jgi:hypothetical protein